MTSVNTENYRRIRITKYDFQRLKNAKEENLMKNNSDILTIQACLICLYYLHSVAFVMLLSQSFDRNLQISLFQVSVKSVNSKEISNKKYYLIYVATHLSSGCYMSTDIVFCFYLMMFSYYLT